MYFGDLLKRFRERRQYTLRDLGALSGLDHAYISRLENGDKYAPSDHTINVLAKALKLTRREELILGILSYQAAPESLVDFVLLKPNYTVDDFETLASICPPGMAQQTHGVWMELMIEVQGLRLRIGSL